MHLRISWSSWRYAELRLSFVMSEWDFDFQMRMATALSLSAVAEEALVQSREQGQLPAFLLVKNIVPNGWCFYDCVRERNLGGHDTGCTNRTTSGPSAPPTQPAASSASPLGSPSIRVERET